jgi:outer membrane protein TolC
LEQARERRPDYYQALLAVDTAQRNLVLAENQALPQLDVFSTFREDGLGSNPDRAWDALASGRFYSWSAGVQVNLPLFLRSERARARAAKIDLERSEATLQSVEANLVLNVRGAIRDIHTAKAQIEASRESRILAARRLKATRTRVTHGTAVPRDVLDDVADLAAAESREIQAYIQYRLSLSGLKQSQGTLLDRWLDVLDPRVRRSLERDPYDYE